jgi:hypothetical protein
MKALDLKVQSIGQAMENVGSLIVLWIILGAIEQDILIELFRWMFQETVALKGADLFVSMVGACLQWLRH